MDNGTGMQSSTGSAGLRAEARTMPSEPNAIGGMKRSLGNEDRKWETGFHVRHRHLIENLHANKHG